jgi:Concanavalin A-like lectin/glucanases superfamily
MSVNTNSADFGSSNSTKSLTKASSLGITHQNFTISFWIKFYSTGSQTLFFLRTTGGGTNYIDWSIKYTGTNLEFHRSKPGIADQSFSVGWSPGTTVWHHVYMKYDTATLRGGADGVELGNSSLSGVGSSGADSFGLGFDGSSSYSSLKMDDVRIWNTNKSDASLWAEYTAPSALVGNETNLQAYYIFDSSLTTDLTSNSFTLTNNGTVTQSTDVPFPGSFSVSDTSVSSDSTALSIGFNISVSDTSVSSDSQRSIIWWSNQSKNNSTWTNQTKN